MLTIAIIGIAAIAYVRRISTRRRWLYHPVITKLCDDAAEKFISMGFKNVCTYENGLEGWADAGNRVDRSEKKMT